jgi:hypothetical protein
MRLLASLMSPVSAIYLYTAGAVYSLCHSFPIELLLALCVDLPKYLSSLADVPSPNVILSLALSFAKSLFKLSD